MAKTVQEMKEGKAETKVVTDETVVQRMSFEVTGKQQKYTRIGLCLYIWIFCR